MSTSSLSTKSSFDSLRSGSSSIQSAPDLLPPAVKGPMVWEGFELKDYILLLSPSEIEAVVAAVEGFKSMGLSRGSINKSTFSLPEELAEKLSSISHEVYHGRGIAVLRGLDVAELNEEDSVIAFAGVSSYVCPDRATDSYAFQTLSHVRDATHDPIPDFARGIGLAGSKVGTAMGFHCDRFSGDILALHVLEDGGAANGGEQFISSFWKVYNELLETEPTVLETAAAASWPFELKQEGADPYLQLEPVLFFSEGKPIIQLVKAPLLGTPRLPRSKAMPDVSSEQRRAMEVIESVAKRFSAKVDRKNGDIQFINNLGVMHARSAYGGAQRSSRHLLRMFLRDPANMWEVPKAYAAKFDDAFTEGREQNLPVIDADPWRKTSGRYCHG
ncbi:Clavaminate synthase-like protein [Pleomassaria siparia CBS 279.74]|uniref:Clavaminate synthase-like protein n=1 Tax=Pleomassaria siparia CBS 279.74 TaxID=1314801 RepID=A0A6G1KI15_9PLEO|nr:Clavaminate synthase-like protein [Pleomassaria siparia CBS 279.74]